MTAEQKEIRDQDLADAVYEAVEQLKNTIAVADKHGLQVGLYVHHEEGSRKFEDFAFIVSREF